MEMKYLILIAFSIGLIAGWNNDRAKKKFFEKNNIYDHLFMIPTILFILYSFWVGIYSGFIVLLQIILGSYIGGNSNRLIKRILKR